MIGILLEATRQGLDKAGISCNDAVAPPADVLASREVWPIYTGLAKNIASDGEEIRFRSANRGVDMSLPEFVAASYVVFREADGAFSSDLSTKVKDFISAYVL
jgi:hypothetical protein